MEKYKNINFLLYTHPAQYDLAVKHNMTDVYNELNIKDLQGRFIDILHKKYIDSVKLKSRTLDLSNYVN